MSGYLVPVAYHRLDGIGIALRAPARYEESLPDPIVAVRIEDPRHGHVGSVAQHRGRPGHAVRGLRRREVQEALRIHVQREARGASRAVRPGNGITYQVHRAVLPPSTHQAAPVTNAAASLAKNATTGAMSAGKPSRARGTAPISAARAAPGLGCVANSSRRSTVSTGPGHTALTRTPWPASSSASARLQASTAPLVAQ